MGTKTADETGAETGAETTTDEEKVNAGAIGEVTETEAEDTGAEDTEAEAVDVVTKGEETDASAVGQGAGAVVAAGLGLVSLTGGWIGTVAAARETLVGQLRTSSSANVATQIKEVYGDAWQTTALWSGLFALLAVIVGVVVLARPAFGAPGRSQAAWIKSVAWGGVALGVIGLLLAVLKYTDALLGLPSAG
ncbi:hypothetical protein [Streptomyces sp. NL15-2K]|uniref:hypothetical protein n=1 Tax=Streptomyces sp. NL15-2K TaxID=376149 RepID=UPI000F56F515|nr:MULTISPECIES: hypothetical protein [Actinomycetes]WKX12866.1 hypothetical protein Q4V64_37210 [Kutzneria buriramensis]